MPTKVWHPPQPIHICARAWRRRDRCDLFGGRGTIRVSALTRAADVQSDDVPRPDSSRNVGTPSSGAGPPWAKDSKESESGSILTLLGVLLIWVTHRWACEICEIWARGVSPYQPAVELFAEPCTAPRRTPADGVRAMAACVRSRRPGCARTARPYVRYQMTERHMHAHSARGHTWFFVSSAAWMPDRVRGVALARIAFGGKAVSTTIQRHGTRNGVHKLED